MKHILFVCSGNTCRSPMAAALLRKGLKTHSKLLRVIEVDSAGVNASSGQPAAPEALDVMTSYGIDMSKHLSKRLSVELIQWADLILTMEEVHKERILRNYPSIKGKTYLLTEFVGKKGDIPDPIELGKPAYERCAKTLALMIREIINKLSQ